VVAGLVVYEDHMQNNIYRTRGLIFSQELMLALVGKGLLREEAYRLVQRNAMQSWEAGRDFDELVRNDPEIMAYLTEEDLQQVFAMDIYTANVDYIFRRCGLD